MASSKSTTKSDAPKQQSDPPKDPIVLKLGTGAYEIQKEVCELESKTCVEDFKETLETHGNKHTFYYHYTTLSTLLKIISSGAWKLRRMDCSNDPFERPVFAAAFTASGISSMGMWHWYSKAGQNDEVGVRIGIPQSVFKEIFKKENLVRQKTNGKFESIALNSRNQEEIHISDVAYWHFGKNARGTNDIFYYKSFSLPFNALANQSKNTTKKFTRPNENNLPPYFKKAIWRTENEVRVYVAPGEKSTSLKESTEIFCKIPPEAFEKMTFYIDPSIGKGGLASSIGEKINGAASALALEFFLGGKIKPEQFLAFDEAELNTEEFK